MRVLEVRDDQKDRERIPLRQGGEDGGFVGVDERVDIGPQGG
jgi:hypothetical protein